jgi:radical SAM-linked protein
VNGQPASLREPRQRWRFVAARDAEAPPLAQREVAESWEAAIDRAGLPVAWTEGARPRPRISFGAPLPVQMAAERELIDLVLTERWPAWRVREALEGRLPDGWRLVELEDVWLGGPPLAGRVAAADYRITLVPGPEPAKLAEAAAKLLAAGRVDRQRLKGTETVSYDLRTLVVDVRLVAPGPPPIVGTRTRFHPELGTGRPEEVVAAMGEQARLDLEIGSIVRERLLLLDEIG